MKYEIGKTYDITDVAEEQETHQEYIKVFMRIDEWWKVMLSKIMEWDYDGAEGVFTAEQNNISFEWELNLDKIVEILHNDDLFCWNFEVFKSKDEAIDHIKDGKLLWVLNYLS